MKVLLSASADGPKEFVGCGTLDLLPGGERKASQP